MNEKPILFNTEMVKAVLGGRKTQTRRVIKNIGNDNCIVIKKSTTRKTGTKINIRDPRIIEHARYEVGMKLWVRETWADPSPDKDGCSIMYLADMPMHWDDSEMGGPVDLYAKDYKWRPSTQIPREFSRINLEITNIRVERIQDITQEDAFSEGVTRKMRNDFGYAAEESEETFNNLQAKSTFRLLWDSINKERGYGWDNNPYVWVYDFKVI